MSPISVPRELSSNSTSGESLVPWPGPNTPNIRSSYEILWSSLVTMFACVYTALHMNIPTLRDSNFARIRRRTKWVFFNFLAPEMIALHALIQYSVCHGWTSSFRKRTRCTREEWSLTHSFYSSMGGFIITLPSGEVLPVLPDEIAALVEQNLISFPIISKAEIEDKSKTDYLGKTFVCLQVLWFAINIMTRAYRHDAITPFELTTVAYVTCTLGTYASWWNKPSDIQLPTVIDGSQFPEETCADLLRADKNGDRIREQRISLNFSYTQRSCATRVLLSAFLFSTVV